MEGEERNLKKMVNTAIENIGRHMGVIQKAALKGQTAANTLLVAHTSRPAPMNKLQQMNT